MRTASTCAERPLKSEWRRRHCASLSIADEPLRDLDRRQSVLHVCWTNESPLVCAGRIAIRCGSAARANTLDAGVERRLRRVRELGSRSKQVDLRPGRWWLGKPRTRGIHGPPRELFSGWQGQPRDPCTAEYGWGLHISPAEDARQVFHGLRQDRGPHETPVWAGDMASLLAVGL